MSRRLRFSLPHRWRKALTVDGGLAAAEGLAAGTGLLTGDLIRTSSERVSPCPQCGGRGEVAVIDLVAHQVSRRCYGCGHRWDAPTSLGSPAKL